MNRRRRRDVAEVEEDLTIEVFSGLYVNEEEEVGTQGVTLSL